MQMETTQLITLTRHCEKVSVEICHMPTKLNRCLYMGGQNAEISPLPKLWGFDPLDSYG